MLRRQYPGGKDRAFNVSYDDGVLQDVRFVELLDRYGLKGTFNLNSGLMLGDFQWTHPNGMRVRRLPADWAVSLYQGHEVAAHSYSHPYMDTFCRDEVLKELAADRLLLQELFHREIRGYATPFHFYSDLMAQCAEDCGFAYARISETDPSYDPWRERYRWKAGIFHEDPALCDYVEGFLSTDRELALCQIVGHSYDLDASGMWNKMETIFRTVSAKSDLWPATHLQIVEYLDAMGRAEITEHTIYNPTDRILWFCLDGQSLTLKPGETRNRQGGSL